MPDQSQSGMGRPTPRAAGWLGIAFVVLLFISAGMVSLPSSASDPEKITAFYAANRTVILIAQLLGLAAIPVFIAFAFGLEKTASRPPLRGIALAGVLVGFASLLTSLPVIALALSSQGVPLWARLTNLTDALLFLTIALFGAVVAVRGEKLPAWLRGSAAVMGLVALARGIAGFAGAVSVLATVAPLIFLAFVLIVGIDLLVVAGRKSASK